MQNKASRLLGNDDAIVATTMIVGTPAFLPPEYFQIKRNEEAMQLAELTRDISDLEESINRTATNGSQTSASASLSSSGDAQANNLPPQTFAGRAADVWALGVTLFAFMFGGLPQTYVPRTRRPSLNQSASSSRRRPSIEQKYSSGEAGTSPRLAQRSPSTSSARSSITGSGGTLTAEEMEERIISFSLRFPGTGLGTSARLRSLLTRMLNKDPRYRITINEICQHDWLTVYEPMPGLSATQKTPIEPTRADQNNAFLRPGGFFTSVKRYFRTLRSKAHVFGYAVDDQIRRTRTRELKSQEKNSREEERINQDEIFE